MHREPKVSGHARLLIVAAALCALAGPAMAFEIKMFAIEDFLGSECGGGDRDKWANMVDRWYDKMEDKGHSKDGSYVDGWNQIGRFCDDDYDSACYDHQTWGPDEADAAIIATHGSDSGDHWAGLMRYENLGQCYINANGDEARWGDDDAEFIVLSSCNSADDDNLNGIRFSMQDSSSSPSTGRRLHQWNGFHGYMWIGSSFYDEYREFAKDAHSVPISHSWVDNLYETNINCFLGIGDCATQCPVAYAISSTRESCLTRLSHERYNNVYSDPPGNNWYCYRYIVNCDPKGDDPFG